MWARLVFLVGSTTSWSLFIGCKFVWCAQQKQNLCSGSFGSILSSIHVVLAGQIVSQSQTLSPFPECVSFPIVTTSVIDVIIRVIISLLRRGYYPPLLGAIIWDNTNANKENKNQNKPLTTNLLHSAWHLLRWQPSLLQPQLAFLRRFFFYYYRMLVFCAAAVSVSSSMWNLIIVAHLSWKVSQLLCHGTDWFCTFTLMTSAWWWWYNSVFL